MGIAEIISLVALLAQTAANIQADGRASTNAEEDAVLAAAMDRVRRADNELQNIDPDKPQG